MFKLKDIVIIKDLLLFIQSFVQKKYGWGILFILSIIICAISSNYFFNRGVKEGRTTSELEIKSLKNSSKNDSVEILRLERRVFVYARRYDSCVISNSNKNLTNEVINTLNEANRLRDLIKQNNYESSKFNQQLDNILKQ